MSDILSLTLASLEDTQKVASNLAKILKPRDVVFLKGELGAGKTALARFLIQAMTAAKVEVVSPTFTLLQHYPTNQGMVWHFDLYRLEDADEVYELGVEEALEEGICLIEWPERIESLGLFQHPLEVTLTLLTEEGHRQIHLAGNQTWEKRILREF